MEEGAKGSFTELVRLGLRWGWGLPYLLVPVLFSPAKEWVKKKAKRNGVFREFTKHK